MDAACGSALDVALDAFAGVAALYHRRRRHGDLEIRFGVDLNVGGPDRFDFTVMWPAVHRTARLEKLTKDLGVPLLMSGERAEDGSPQPRAARVRRRAGSVRAGVNRTGHNMRR